MASGGRSSSRCTGLSLLRPLLLRSTGSRRAGSVVVAHGPSWSTACGILPDQGSNPCPLHWQADSQPLHHQGSPGDEILKQWALNPMTGVFIYLFLIYFLKKDFFKNCFLAVPRGTWDLSSPTRDQTRTPCTERAES